MSERNYRWQTWKAVAAVMGLRLQYEEKPGIYRIYGFDGPIQHTTELWTGAVPEGVIVGGYSQEQNDNDRADFEANFKDAGNGPLAPRSHSGSPIIAIDTPQANGAARVAIAPTEGSEAIYSTHNLCDPCSWYAESERVENEAPTNTDPDTGLVWQLAHDKVVTMRHGLVQDEDGLVEEEAERTEGHHGWSFVVTVDGDELTEREPLEAAGGEYIVDYEAGTITFAQSQAGKDVRVTYSYAIGSGWKLEPLPGKALEIIDAEAQFSTDVEMTDTITFQVKGLAAVFAPQLGLPEGTKIPLATVHYKRFSQIVDEARGAYPVIPALAGNARGNTNPMYGFPFQYATARVLSSAAGMELWVRTAHGRSFGGERATATFYCSSRNE